jgi:hypothetical protein
VSCAVIGLGLVVVPLAVPPELAYGECSDTERQAFDAALCGYREFA